MLPPGNQLLSQCCFLTCRQPTFSLCHQVNREPFHLTCKQPTFSLSPGYLQLFHLTCRHLPFLFTTRLLRAFISPAGNYLFFLPPGYQRAVSSHPRANYLFSLPPGYNGVASFLRSTAQPCGQCNCPGQWSASVR